MGIPFYFREIVRKNGNIITNLRACDGLYLDFNSVIHTCSYKVTSSKIWDDKQYVEMETEIFKNIIACTEDIVKSCSPKELLYIGVDGVAPLAKINQQRKRRHLTALRNHIINKYKDEHNLMYTKWDSNCITPGTSFMRNLRKYLHKYYQQANTAYRVLISGDDEPGEGEHKIIRYIKEHGTKSSTNVIYGLDADLIMLSLTCRNSNIFLMREANHIQKQDNTTAFKFVDINLLRKNIGHLFSGQHDNQRWCKGEDSDDMDSYRYMLDYVFICFLLGNDFLPHFPSIDLKYNGLQQLCDAYKKVKYNKQNDYMVQQRDNKYTLNTQLFTAFLKELALSEDSNIKRTIKLYGEARYIEKPYKSHLEKFINEVDNLPLLKKKIPFDPDTDEQWKYTYYNVFLKISYNDAKRVNDVCHNYVSGILWNIDYYFNNVSTNKWYYKYNSTPFLSDILNYVYVNFNSDIHQSICVSKDIHITYKEQLMLVLPYQSLNLLPEKYKEVILDTKNGLAHLYPITFQVNTFLKSQLWECMPYLPALNIDKIKNLATQDLDSSCLP